MEQLTEFFSNPLRLTLIAASVVILFAIIIVSLKPRKRDNTPRKDYSNFHTIDNLETGEANTPATTFESLPDADYLVAKTDDILEEYANPLDTPEDSEWVAQSTAKPKVALKQQESQDLSAETAAKEPEDFVILHVTTPTGFSIPGDALSHILGELGMVFGPHNIFHYFDQKNNAMPLFSVVNLVEPGYFDLKNPEEFTTTGVSFLMRLPLPLPEFDSANTYSVMLHLAQRFARHIQGTVLDQDRNVLISQKINQLRKLAEQYAKKTRLAAEEELSV